MIHETSLVTELNKEIDFFTGLESYEEVINWKESDENNFNLSVLPINGAGVMNRLSYYLPNVDVKKLCSGELIDIHYLPKVKYDSNTKNLNKKLEWHGNIIKYSSTFNYFQLKKFMNLAHNEFKMFATLKDIKTTVKFYLNRLCNDSSVVDSVINSMTFEDNLFDICSNVDNIYHVWRIFEYNPCSLNSNVGYQDSYDEYLDKCTDRLGKVFRPLKIGVYGTTGCKPFNKVVTYDGLHCLYLSQEDKDKLNKMFSYNGRLCKKFFVSELKSHFPVESLNTLYESLRQYKKTHDVQKITEQEFDSLKEDLSHVFSITKTYFIGHQDITEDAPRLIKPVNSKVVKVEVEKAPEVAQNVKETVVEEKVVEVKKVLNTPIKNSNLQKAIDKCNEWLAAC